MDKKEEEAQSIGFKAEEREAKTKNFEIKSEPVVENKVKEKDPLLEDFYSEVNKCLGLPRN